MVGGLADMSLLMRVQSKWKIDDPLTVISAPTSLTWRYSGMNSLTLTRTLKVDRIS